VKLGGGAIANAQGNTQVSHDLEHAERLAFPFIFLLSLLFFRSLVAALLPPIFPQRFMYSMGIAGALVALLVPSLMALLGSLNWWAPRPLRRLHERVGLQETAPSPARPLTQPQLES
jgi:uncharacterized membrane protein YdfJ with MMPL/SSD domain